MKSLFSILLIFCLTGFNPIKQIRNDQAYEIAVNNLIDRINDTCYWNKIHSIEFLIDLNFNEIAEKVIQDDLIKFENTPYKRIGYWRCSAMNEPDEEKKKIYIDKIRDIYLNPINDDVIHAAESLAKLSSSLKKYPKTALEDTLKNNILKGYENWACIIPVNTNDQIDYDMLFRVLKTSNKDHKRIMAYGIKYLGNIGLQYWKKLYELAIEESLDSPCVVYLLSGALSTYPLSEKDKPCIKKIRDRLKYLSLTNDKCNQYESFIALGNFGLKDDFHFIKDRLLKMSRFEEKKALNDEEKDILSAVSFAYLKLLSQNDF